METHTSLWARAAIVWLGLIIAETSHGVVRTLYLAPVLGDFRARQLAVFTGSALILTLAVMVIRWLHPANAAEALGVGVVWLVLTLIFELAFGRYVLHATWARIAEDYNLVRGGLLSIGLLVLTAAPLVAARLRNVF
jgi:hypothetical protein